MFFPANINPTLTVHRSNNSISKEFRSTCSPIRKDVSNLSVDAISIVKYLQILNGGRSVKSLDSIGFHFFLCAPFRKHFSREIFFLFCMESFKVEILLFWYQIEDDVFLRGSQDKSVWEVNRKRKLLVLLHCSFFFFLLGYGNCAFWRQFI